MIEVYQLGGPGERYVGRARLIHTEWRDLPWQSYGFRFVDKSGEWILYEEKTGTWKCSCARLHLNEHPDGTAHLS